MAEIVSKCCCPIGAEVKQGTVMVLLVLNQLMVPRPLYKVTDWMTHSILSEVVFTAFSCSVILGSDPPPLTNSPCSAVHRLQLATTCRTNTRI